MNSKKIMLTKDFNYLRSEIEKMKFGMLNNTDKIVRDIKDRMLLHVDNIENYYREIDSTHEKIKCERAMIKDLVDSWKTE